MRGELVGLVPSISVYQVSLRPNMVIAWKVGLFGMQGPSSFTLLLSRLLHPVQGLYSRAEELGYASFWTPITMQS